MSQWFQVIPQVWETSVAVCERAATVRVEAEQENEGRTWAMCMRIDGAVCVTIGGYPSAAHARQSLADVLVQGLARQTRNRMFG